MFLSIKSSISAVMCTADFFHILLKLLKYIIVQKISCANACAYIFYSLNANEKMVKNAQNRLSRIKLEVQKTLKSGQKS